MIKSDDGHKYSPEPFEGYTHRAKVEVRSSYTKRPFSRDIYTDNPLKESVLLFLEGSRYKEINPSAEISIIHWCTKEQDGVIAQFIDEL